MFTSVGEKQLKREFYCSLFHLSESELAVVKFLQGFQCIALYVRLCRLHSEAQCCSRLENRSCPLCHTEGLDLVR